MGSAGNTSHLPQLSPGDNVENITQAKRIVNGKVPKQIKHKHQILPLRKQLKNNLAAYFIRAYSPVRPAVDANGAIVSKNEILIFLKDPDIVATGSGPVTSPDGNAVYINRIILYAYSFAGHADHPFYNVVSAGINNDHIKPVNIAQAVFAGQKDTPALKRARHRVAENNNMLQNKIAKRKY